MAFLEKELYIKTSTIPGAGMGLFTSVPIKKGTRIIEYKGRKTSWKEITDCKIFNAYVFYISEELVIDAKPYKKQLARYANDAKGLEKRKGITNNCEYVNAGERVFLDATRNIAADAEILVGYGADYWKVIRSNMRLAEKETRQKAEENTREK